MFFILHKWSDYLVWLWAGAKARFCRYSTSASVVNVHVLLWTYYGPQPSYSAASSPGHMFSHRPSADESPTVLCAGELGGEATQLVERPEAHVLAAVTTSTVVVEVAVASAQQGPVLVQSPHRIRRRLNLKMKNLKMKNCALGLCQPHLMSAVLFEMS